MPQAQPSRGAPLAAGWTTFLALVVALSVAGCSPSREERLAAFRAQVESGNATPESIEEFRQVLAEDPADPEANFLLGSALSASLQWSRAIIPLQKALEAEAYRRDSAVLLTAAFLNTQNEEGALAVADRLIELEAEEPTGWHLRARANLSLNRIEEAVEDTERLVALTPDDFTALELKAAALLAAERSAEAVEALTLAEARAEARGDLASAGRSCMLAARTVAEEASAEGEFDDSRLARCTDAYPTDPSVLSEAATVYNQMGKLEQATQLYENAVALAPEILRFRIGLANQRWVEGEPEGAIETMTQAAEDFASAAAFLGLAEFQRLHGDLDAALESAAQAVELAPGDPSVVFRRAELLIEAGRLDEARGLAAELPESAQKKVLTGKIQLESDDPAGALETLEAALVEWPNNAPARALAGHAAQQLLDLDRALAHYREAVRADPRASNAGLIAARALHALGRDDDAVLMLVEHGKAHPQDVAAFRFAIQLGHASGKSRLLEETVALMARGTAEAQAGGMAERVSIRSRSEGPRAAAELVAKEGCDLREPVCEPVLAALADAWQRAGNPKRALRLVDDALESRPEAVSLHNLRGRLLLAQDRNAQARAAFERCIEAQPEYGPAFAGLGAVALREGDPARSVELFDRAAALTPGDADSPLRAAQVLLASGATDEAERRLRELLGRHPASTEAANDLAWILAEAGRDLDLALRLARQAVRVQPIPNYLDTLAWVQLRRDVPDEAIETLGRAIEGAPGDPRLRYRLALAQLAADDPEAARSSLETALAGGTFPEAEDARARLARLQAGGSN